METTQSNKVYEYILEKIKLNIWRSGERIYTEKQLCEELDISRIAVRTALDKLSALGILEKRKGSGTYVSKIDISNIVSNIVPLMTLKPMDILDVLRFRLYFEPGNVREFMRNHSLDDVKALKETYEMMELNRQDKKQCYLSDLKFHTLIARGTKNPIIISINEMLTGVLEASLDVTYGTIRIGPELSLKSHRNILDAILKGDSELATLLMTRHIEDNIKRLEERTVEDI